MNGNPEPHRRVRRQGPATLRGKNIPPTTTDQRLLDRRGPSDWVHTDPWRVLRIQAEFVEGFGLPCLLVLKRLPEGERHDKSKLNAILRDHGVDA